MLKNNPYMKSYLNIISESSNIEKYQQIAKEIGGVYIPETNTIDCKGKKVKFKNSWLDENGSFNFKLINTSNDWFDMFKWCALTHLPDDFIIPEGVTNCSSMFENCKSLTHLPDNFIIPNTVIDCFCMFSGCESLTHLPDNFTIPDSVTCCNAMFYECYNLTHLPDNFTLSDNIIDCNSMFYDCIKLKKLPDNFTIPNNIKDCNSMFYNCSLKYLPNNFIIPNDVENCSSMFENCKQLTHLPEQFRIPANGNYKWIFDGCDKLENKDPETYTMWEI